MAWLFKVMKGKILQQRLLYPTRLIQINWRNEKLSRQAKIKRIKHHKTSFTTNTKGTSLGRHTRERNDLYKTNPKQLRKRFILLLFSCSVVSNSLRPHGLQHTRLPCPSLSTRACSNSCILSRWSHLTFSSCHPLLLPSIFPIIKVFSNKSALHIKWARYWSLSFSIGSSKEYSVLISFRIDWLDLLAVQGTLKSLLQHHSSKASILWCSASLLSHPCCCSC